MDTQITARHFSASKRLKDFVNTRVGKLERFYDGITDARVILSKHNKSSGGPKTAEITLNVRRNLLIAQEEAHTYEEAIDRCVSRLRRQILKYKGKRRG